MMRTGIFLNYAGGFLEAVDQVVELEKVGVDIALVAEAYSYDAISQLGFLAAKTSRIELGTGVVPIYIRTPSLLAMTAAGLDYVSDGRFRLGIGTSGPQVMEGFHGVPFDAPLGRTREVVEICRQVWRRENGSHIDGKYYQIPLPARPGHRPRQAAASDQSPCPRTHSDHDRRAGPEERRADRGDRRGLAAGVLLPREGRRGVGRRRCGPGMAKRDPELGPLDIMVSATPGHRRRRRRPAGLGETPTGAVHRRHGRARQELLPQPGHPLRVRRGGRPHPGSLSGGQEGRGHRGGARRVGAQHRRWSARAASSRSASPPTPKPESRRCCCIRLPPTEASPCASSRNCRTCCLSGTVSPGRMTRSTRGRSGRCWRRCTSHPTARFRT